MKAKSKTSSLVSIVHNRYLHQQFIQISTLQSEQLRLYSTKPFRDVPDFAIVHDNTFRLNHCFLLVGEDPFFVASYQAIKNGSIRLRWSNTLHMMDRLALFYSDRLQWIDFSICGKCSSMVDQCCLESSSIIWRGFPSTSSNRSQIFLLFLIDGRPRDQNCLIWIWRTIFDIFESRLDKHSKCF